MYESYINKIEDVGKLRNLKPGTIRNYQNNIRQYLDFIQKAPETLTCEDARTFLLYLKNKGDKASTLNNKNGSLVFFYKRVLGKLWDDNLVPRAINDYAVPKVLSRTEIDRLLDATPNLKNIKQSLLLCIHPVFGYQKCFIYIMTTFPERTCRFIYMKPKPTPPGMLFYPNELWIFLRNTGLSVVDPKEYCFPISGPGIISLHLQLV